jgi:hypothetical protein
MTNDPTPPTPPPTPPDPHGLGTAAGMVVLLALFVAGLAVIAFAVLMGTR